MPAAHVSARLWCQSTLTQTPTVRSALGAAMAARLCPPRRRRCPRLPRLLRCRRHHRPARRLRLLSRRSQVRRGGITGLGERWHQYQAAGSAGQLAVRCGCQTSCCPLQPCRLLLQRGAASCCRTLTLWVVTCRTAKSRSPTAWRPAARPATRGQSAGCTPGMPPTRPATSRPRLAGS